MELKIDFNEVENDEEKVLDKLDEQINKLILQKHETIQKGVYYLKEHKIIIKIVLDTSNEYRIAKILNNNNIDNIYEIIKLEELTIFDTTSNAYLKGCMIYMPRYNYTLANLSINLKSQTVKKEICLKLLNGIKNIHKLGYNHGDIKPSNVCYENNDVRIIDMGLSEKLDTSADTICTFGWFTPLQSTKSNHFSESKSKTIIKNIKKDNPYLYESYILNDYFNLGLMIIFIYGNKYNFYTRSININICDDKNNDLIYNNMIKFVSSPITYLVDVILDINNITTDIDHEIIDMLYNYILGIFPNIKL